jgi:predicted outer membrane repeat protein
MARRRRSFGRQRPAPVRRRLLPHRRPLRFEPLESRLCLSAAQLVGHWTFDNDHVSGNIVEDTAPALGEFHGEKMNDGPTTGVVGVVGEAAKFDGGENNSTSHYVDLSDHADDFGGLATGTISAWVKPDADGPTPGVLTIFSVSNSSVGSEEMRFFVANEGSFGTGTLVYGVRAGTSNGDVVSANANLLDGEWHHVAVTVGAANTAQIYIDGVLEGTNTISFMTDLSANASALGRNLDNTFVDGTNPGQWFFGGGMDDVGLWDDSLAPAEVQALVRLAQHVQLNYNLGQAEQLFNLADAGSGMIEVGGRTWEGVTGLSGNEGIIVDQNGVLSLHLGGGNGVQSDAVPFVVTSTADVGPGTLRATIDQANAVTGADTITFDAAVDGGTVLMGLGQMQITEAVTIDATSLAGGFTIDAQQQSRIFNIDDLGVSNDFDVTIAGLTLTRGQTTGDNPTFIVHTFSGGAIRSLSTGNLTIEQSTISDSHVSGNRTRGGGVFTRGEITFTDSTVSGNSAMHTGGGIFTLEHVTLTDSTVSENSAGGSGGGIYASGDVTLTQSTVSGNSSNHNGGGIYGSGNVTLTQSTVSGNSSNHNGGGIYANDDVTLTQSTVTDNNGGGIYAQGDVTLTQSTVSGNSTARDFAPGGGIRAQNATLTQSTVSGNSSGSHGGGIIADDDVTLTQSTVSGNSSDGIGGGIYAGGDVTLTQSTISGNSAASFGGGISAFRFDLNGSIVAGNTAGSFGPDLRLQVGGSATATYSLIGDNTGTELDPAPAGMPDANGNQIGTSGAPIDPLLGPLADNGGPTQTHALLAGSPAIDAGDPNIVFDANEFDQRGAPFVRVFDGNDDTVSTIDMGAFERQFLNLVVNSTSDESDGDFSAGNLSLREAVELTNANPNVDTITFASALSGQTIILGGTELVLTEALVIDARPLAANITIDANGASRILNITAESGDFTLGGLTLSGARTTASGLAGLGGAIRSRTTGNLTLEQSTVSGNSTAGGFARGGGIYTRGDVTLTQSTVSGNSTSGQFSGGGGISTFGDLTLTNSTVSGNSTAGLLAGGGGIYTYGDLTLAQSTVSGNSTAGVNSPGGGIWVNGSAELTQSTVTENHTSQASSSGGGVFQWDTGNNAPFSISGSIVAGNTAGGGGADLLPDPDSTLTVNYSLIGNMADLTQSQLDAINAGTGNLLDVAPQVGPLADNGGMTLTHALLPGSPALDAGDPNAMAGVGDVPEFDQRGNPFKRVFDGDGAGGARIDIGAFEVQPIPAAFYGDYNQNGIADAADYTVWRDTLGQTGVTPYSRADGDGDGMITSGDYQVWKDHFGEVVPLPGAASGAVAAVAVEQPSALVLSAVGEDESPATGANDNSTYGAQQDLSGTPPTFVAAGDLLDLRSSLVAESRFRTASRVGVVRGETPSPRAVDLVLAVTERASSNETSNGAISLYVSDDEEAAGDEISPLAVDAALAGLAATF